jgi:hypothetical protein
MSQNVVQLRLRAKLRQPVKRGPTNQQMSVRATGANRPIRILVSNVKSSKSKANLSWSSDYAHCGHSIEALFNLRGR